MDESLNKNYIKRKVKIMENNIMANEEVVESVTEELVTTNSGLTSIGKTVAVLGITAAVGFGLYKLGKRIVAKAKAKKEKQKEKLESEEKTVEDLRIYDDEGNPIER